MVIMRGLLLVLLFCIAHTAYSVTSTEAEANLRSILDNLGGANYSKAIRPNYGASPVHVNLSMYIMSISDVSADDHQYRAQFYLRHRWIDPRLSFTPKPGVAKIFSDGSLSEKIWVPDTFFANVRTVTHQKKIVRSDETEFCRIEPNGEVFISKMIDLVAYCPMDLRYFPFDQQLCSIEMESYGYSRSDIDYHWIDNKSAAIGDHVESKDFAIVGIKQMEKYASLSTGNYSRLVVQLHLVRVARGFLWQVYLPILILVVLSWVPLWLDSNKHSIRITFNLLLLAIFTILSANHAGLIPTTAYLKTIDVYLLVSFLLICLSLLEVSLVAIGSIHCPYAVLNEAKNQPSTGNCLERFARWIIPAVGLLYYIVYWFTISSATSIDFEAMN